MRLPKILVRMLTALARADVLAQPLARRRDGCHGAVQPHHALAEALAAGAQLGAHARRDGCERLAVGPGLQGVTSSQRALSAF